MLSTIIQFPAVVSAADSTTRDVPMFAAVPFTAMCPKCKDVRYQRGYTPRSLFRLLGRNHVIEAYCVVCDLLSQLVAVWRQQPEWLLNEATNKTPRPIAPSCGPR